MTTEQTNALTNELGEALGKPLAEVTVGLLAIIRALQKQEGFNVPEFQKEIQETLESIPDDQKTLKSVLSAVL